MVTAISGLSRFRNPAAGIILLALCIGCGRQAGEWGALQTKRRWRSWFAPRAQFQVRACMHYMHPRADSGPATWAGTRTMREMDHRIRHRDRKCSSHLPRPQTGSGGYDARRRSTVRSQKKEQRRWKFPQSRQPQRPPTCLLQSNGVTKRRRHHQLF
jgi:hypothetical protein